MSPALKEQLTYRPQRIAAFIELFYKFDPLNTFLVKQSSAGFSDFGRFEQSQHNVILQGLA